jgi:hypothetical protein
MGSMGDGNGPHRKVFSELSVGTYNDLEHFKDVTTDRLDSLQQAFQKSR